MEKRLYETTVVLNGALEDPAIEEIVGRVKEFITQNGGEFKEEERIGRRRLIFAIDKRTNGYYYGAQFHATPDVVGRLEKMYVLEEQVLRFLTIAVDQKLLVTRDANRKRAEERQKEADAKRALEEIAIEDVPKVVPVPVGTHEVKHAHTAEKPAEKTESVLTHSQE